MASVNITVAQYIADSYNHADDVTILDTAANLAGLTAGQIGNLVANGVEHINSSDDVLTWNVAQWQAVPTSGISFDLNDLKVVFDTGANLATLSTGDLGDLNTFGVTLINPQDGVASFTVAQYQALGGISIDQGADVTLADTGANISGLTAAEIGALAIRGFDVLDASDDAYNLNVEQAQALSGVTVDASDTVTLLDTSANLEALSANDYAILAGAGIAIVDASDDVLTLTDDQLSAIINNGMALTAGDDVTLADTGAAIAGHDFNTLSTWGVDFIDATNNVMSITVNQANELLAGDVVASDSADVITLFDTGANIAGMSAADLGDLGSVGVDFVNASDDALSLTIAQLDALSAGGTGLTAADVVTLADSAASIDALTSGDIGGYISQGVDVIDAAGAGAYSIDAATAAVVAASSLTFAADDAVTLSDTGANLAALTASQISLLKAHGVDAIDASDNTLNLTVAQYGALNGVTLTGADTVTLVDTGANLAAMSVSAISGLAAAGVDAINASDNVLGLSLAQFQALGAVQLTGADDVTVSALGASLAGLSAGDLTTMGEAGVDHIDATDNALSLTVAQASVVAVGGQIGLTGADIVTLADSGANLAGVAAGTFTTYGANGVDRIDSSSDAVSFSVAQVNAIIGASIALTAADTVTLADTSANIDTLTAANITSYDTAGVDIIDSTENFTAYTFDVAAARALEAGAIHLASSDEAVLADTAANLEGLSAAEIGGLAAEGFDSIDSSTDVLSLTVAQYQALNGVILTGADTVTLLDTGANIAALSASALGALGAAGIDIIDASDNVLNLTVAQWQEIFYTAEIGLTGSDVVTVVDTGANLGGMSATDLGNLGGSGVDAIDASDDAVSFSITQLDALSVALTAGDVVTLGDTEANIEALSAGELGGYAAQGVDLIHASDTSTLTMSAAQVGAVTGSAIAFKGSDTVTLSDSGANIAGLSASDFAAMAADGVDAIDANDNLLNLTVAQYRGIAGSSTHLTAGDTVTLVDTGANLASLSAAEIGQLAADNVDRLNASDNVLRLNVAQFSALGAVTLAGGDVVSLTDTGANLATLDFSTLAGKNVDAIDATDNVLTLSYAQFSSLGTVSLAAGDTVTLADASSVIEGLSGAQLLALGGKGIDIIDTTDNVLDLSLTQFNNLGSVVLASNDVVTLADTEAHLDALGAGKINQLNTAGVDFVDSTDGVWAMSAAAAGALAAGAMKATGSDAVSVSDTGAAIAGLSAGELGALGAHNVDSIDASDDALTLSTGQFTALGTVALTGADDVTIADTDALLGTLNFGQLAAKGVDHLDATDDQLHLTVAQYSALGSVTLAAGDVVTLRDSAANLQALTVSQIGALAGDGVDFLDSTSDLLTLTVAKFNALGEVGLTGSDVVTIADTGANLATLDFSVLGGQGVDRIDATDNQLTLTKGQIDLLGSVALTQTDTVTMTAGQASLEALTPGQLATYAAQGVDVLDAASNVLNLEADQVSAMANTGLEIAAGDFVTLSDSSANVIANLGALLGALGDVGVDEIDLTDNAINLTASQGMDLVEGGVGFDVSDTGVVVLDSGDNIEGLDANQMAALAQLGVDSIDATDDSLTLSVGQYAGFVFNGGDLTGSDDVTLADVGANIASLSQAEIQQLVANGIDHVSLTNHQVSLNYGQFTSLTADFSFTGLDTITAKGTNGDNTFVGGAEKDVFVGKGGDDTIDGGMANDTITGGKGTDIMTGGIGADTFVFTSLADSSISASDRIMDLKNVDIIDLSQIDADSTVAGDQAFHEVKKFTGHAGEVMVKFNATSGLTVIKMDVDGDGHADSQIAVEGDHHSFDNFVL